MKTILLTIAVLFSINAHAEVVQIKLAKACAYADDTVIDGEQLDFMISTHSHGYLQQQDSAKFSVTPGKCMGEKKRANYSMNINVDDVGSPLEIQIGEQLIGKIYKLSFGKIIVGTAAQLAYMDCNDPDHGCLNIDDLRKEAQTYEINTKAGQFELGLTLLP